MTPIVDAIDRVLRERVLVFGSLPPEGRDLDLLARAGAEAEVAAALVGLGFLCHGTEWVRFELCTASVVDLVPAWAWCLPRKDLDALFADATPLPGCVNLVRPAPAHSLLIAARKLRRRGARLRERDVARARAAGADPVAWEKAFTNAAAWGVEPQLRLLEEGLRGRRKPPSYQLHRPARSLYVSFSGLDGAGKTAQARALRNALESLGVEAVVEWAPAHQVNLRFLANPIRSLLKMDARSTAPGHSNPDLRPTRHPALVTHAWVTIQAVAIAWSLWRSALSHVGRGRVVIFDRQALDFAVFVLYRHGASHRLGPELRLLRAFAPRPALAFLLDVAGDTARDRKPEQFTVEELRMQARLYRRERSLFAVELLDGEADVEELCSYVAERVWRRLRKAGR